MHISRSVYDGMLWHARAEAPLECCGFLAGTIGADGIGRVRSRYPLRNALASPVEFEADPASLFSACKDIRRQGLEVLAIYHSHPASEPRPSPTDLARNYWSGEVVHIIVSLLHAPPLVCAWRLSAEEYRAAEWTIQEE